MESAPERKADPRAERGLTSMSNQFVPRGQWIFGASASYSTHTNKDYTFLVIEDINSDGYTFKVTPPDRLRDPGQHGYRRQIHLFPLIAPHR